MRSFCQLVNPHMPRAAMGNPPSKHQSSSRTANIAAIPSANQATISQQQLKRPSSTQTSGTPEIQINSQTISESHAPQVQHAFAYGKD